ncbi:MAG: formate/nitrite transporter family protein [Hyphomicrobiales bacterium]
MAEFNPTGLDDYKPAEMARLVEELGVRKAHMPAVQLFTLAVLAGAFIGFGALAFTMVMTGVDLAFGPARFLGGIVFSLGLILVIVGGAELFTGNALLVMALVDGRIGIGAVLRNWGIVYAGNLCGALGLVVLVALAHLMAGPMGDTARRIALAKAALPLDVAFVRGILCNALVCLAVWLTISARSATGKILAIVWPISAFVLLGLEHSVANMYLVPAGWVAGAEVSPAAFLSTLAAVTAGNVVGGAGGVGLAYWLAYRPARQG